VYTKNFCVNLILFFLWGIIMQYQMVPCKIALKTKQSQKGFFLFIPGWTFLFLHFSFLHAEEESLSLFFCAQTWKNFFLPFQKFQVRSFEISFSFLSSRVGLQLRILFLLLNYETFLFKFCWICCDFKSCRIFRISKFLKKLWKIKKIFEKFKKKSIILLKTQFQPRIASYHSIF